MNNKIKCIIKVFICFIFVVSMSYIISYQYFTIKSIKLLNTSLQTYCSDLEIVNETLLGESKEEEVFRFQDMISQLKETDKKSWFILYKSMQEEYDEYLDPCESIYDYFTDEQITMMQKCIETEAFDCSFNAKVNVACVILNRVEHNEYPTDPIEIITGENQFAYGRNNITEDTILALEYAFMIEDTTDGCIAFRSDCSPDTWNGWTKQFTDESGHTFYK